MARRIGLGRGLDALLYNNDDNESPAVNKQPVEAQNIPRSSAAAAKNKEQDVIQLPVNKLVANPGQPRKNFDEAEMQELANSIKTYGIIQPIIAANAGDGTYIIIAGERRTRAARLAGLSAVPVIVRDYTDQKRLEVSLIENIQRSDLNPIEEVAAYKNLMDFSNLSQDELAMRMGKNRSTVANALRLLKLPIEVQKASKKEK
ncbi:MAG: ParB/RepB/Spo0J family partition protein [Treponema sp.]|nr:ParB/RepB/Spo0J family partition protein [Treponema sp.]